MELPGQGFICPKCEHLIAGNPSCLIWHLRNVHNCIHGHLFMDTIICSQDGCRRSFNNYVSTFRTHLVREHARKAVIRNNPVMRGEHQELNDDGGDLIVDEENGAAAELAEYENWDFLTAEDCENRAGIIISELLASSSVVQSTAIRIAQNTGELIQHTVGHLKGKTSNFIKDAGIQHDSEQFENLMTTFDDVINPFKNLTSASKQRKFFEKSDMFVKPQEVPIGVAYVQKRNRQSGNVMQQVRNITCQYIPIKELLSVLLAQPEFWEISEQHVPGDDGLLHDFHDGTYRKDSDVLSSSKTVKLILYIDDFETSNPLSPRAGIHKLGAVYFSFANHPPRFRASMNNIFLLLLFNSQDASLYGYDPIFAPFINDITSLYTDGMQVEGKGLVKVAIAQVTGDNLGLHSLFGLPRGFTAHYFCRKCKMHRDNARQAAMEEAPLLRTRANYEQDLHEGNMQRTGIRDSCSLNDIPGYHIIDNHAFDIMHDLLEGICPLEFKLVVCELVAKQLFTLEMLNSRIVSFDYGSEEAKNRPVVVTDYAIHNPDSSPGQNAAQMWLLIRFLPLIIGDLVPEEDPHWELIISLLELMAYIFAPAITNEETVLLANLISDHHSLYLRLFPDRHLKPKHHFLTHYASSIRQVGPLSHLWVMRFEAKHNFSRRLSHIVCNFQNIAKTLAYRNQINLTYNLLANKTFCESNAVGPGTSVLLSSVTHAGLVSEAAHVAMYDDVFIPNWCIVQGVKYAKHQMVVVGKYQDDNDPIFGKISEIVLDDSRAWLVLQIWHTFSFNRHFQGYEVLPTEEVTVKNIRDILDYHPLHAVKLERGYFISTRWKLE